MISNTIMATHGRNKQNKNKNTFLFSFQTTKERRRKQGKGKEEKEREGRREGGRMEGSEGRRKGNVRLPQSSPNKKKIS